MVLTCLASHATLGFVGKGEQNQTIALDPDTTQELISQPLPFVRGGVGIGVVTSSELEPPKGAEGAEGAPGAPGVIRVPIALATLPFRQGSALRLSVIVKASLSLESSPMTPAEEAEPYHAGDLHHRNQPMAHVVSASDRAPWKLQVDVTLLGQACAPKGQAVSEMGARFALIQGGKTVIDKRVRVVGDRESSDAEPEPFTKMPIVYERAFGGMATAANPIGCGEDAEDEQPNILDPENPWRPSGFGPIPQGWPLRSRRLGDLPRRAMDAAVMELPPNFDWGYFQSAPPDQQLPELAPDARVVLEGFDPDEARLEYALPDARAVGAVYGLDDAEPDAPTQLAFRADTLHIDVTRKRATITFRAYIDLRDEAQMDRLHVAAGVGLGEALPSIPSARPAIGAAKPSEPTSAAAPGAVSTLDLPLVSTERASQGAALPFAQGGQSPLARAGGAPAAPAPDAGSTLALPEMEMAEPVAAPPPAAAVAPMALFTESEPARPPAPLPETPERKASDFFHDVSKLRQAPGLVPRAKDELREALPQSPEEEIDLERYARVSAALAEPGAQRHEVFATHEIDLSTWRKADRSWRRALERETRRGERALRTRFDDVYIEAWEAAHPERYTIAHHARLLWAEKRGFLMAELEEQGLDAALGTRLLRVYRRRVDRDPVLGEALARALRELGAA